jgi:uncharacterized protein YbjT (DUF2867 family)
MDHWLVLLAGWCIHPRKGWIGVRVMIFGATGMVGQGVLKECLKDPDVTKVLVVGRRSTGTQHPKLREVIHSNLFDFEPIKDQLAGYDACFFCLGMSSFRMKERDYRRVTFDLTLGAARILAALNPQMTFVYVSGTGTDSSARGRIMWARVKGETENALLDLPFKAYMFRPGYIQPMHGIKSKTGLYAAAYKIGAPLYPLFKRLFPNKVTTTEQVGRAMIAVAKSGAPKRVLETADINAAR